MMNKSSKNNQPTPSFISESFFGFHPKKKDERYQIEEVNLHTALSKLKLPKELEQWFFINALLRKKTLYRSSDQTIRKNSREWPVKISLPKIKNSGISGRSCENNPLYFFPGRWGIEGCFHKALPVVLFQDSLPYGNESGTVNQWGGTGALNLLYRQAKPKKENKTRLPFWLFALKISDLQNNSVQFLRYDSIKNLIKSNSPSPNPNFGLYHQDIKKNDETNKIFNLFKIRFGLTCFNKIKSKNFNSRLYRSLVKNSVKNQALSEKHVESRLKNDDRNVSLISLPPKSLFPTKNVNQRSSFFYLLNSPKSQNTLYKFYTKSTKHWLKDFSQVFEEIGSQPIADPFLYRTGNESGRRWGETQKKNNAFITNQNLFYASQNNDVKDLKMTENKIIKRTALLKFLQILDGFYNVHGVHRSKGLFKSRPRLDTINSTYTRELFSNFRFFQGGNLEGSPYSELNEEYARAYPGVRLGRSFHSIPSSFHIGVEPNPRLGGLGSTPSFGMEWNDRPNLTLFHTRKKKQRVPKLAGKGPILEGLGMRSPYLGVKPPNRHALVFDKIKNQRNGLKAFFNSRFFKKIAWRFFSTCSAIYWKKSINKPVSTKNSRLILHDHQTSKNKLWPEVEITNKPLSLFLNRYSWSFQNPNLHYPLLLGYWEWLTLILDPWSLQVFNQNLLPAKKKETKLSDNFIGILANFGVSFFSHKTKRRLGTTPSPTRFITVPVINPGLKWNNRPSLEGLGSTPSFGMEWNDRPNLTLFHTRKRKQPGQKWAGPIWEGLTQNFRHFVFNLAQPIKSNTPLIAKSSSLNLFSLRLLRFSIKNGNGFVYKRVVLFSDKKIKQDSKWKKETHKMFWPGFSIKSLLVTNNNQKARGLFPFSSMKKGQVWPVVPLHSKRWGRTQSSKALPVVSLQDSLPYDGNESDQFILHWGKIQKILMIPDLSFSKKPTPQNHDTHYHQTLTKPSMDTLFFGFQDLCLLTTSKAKKDPADQKEIAKAPSGYLKPLNLLCVWPSFIQDILGPSYPNDSGSFILPEYFQPIGHGPKLKKQGITMIASTDDLTNLDAALLRPGRFDTVVNYSKAGSILNEMNNFFPFSKAFVSPHTKFISHWDRTDSEKDDQIRNQKISDHEIGFLENSEKNLPQNDAFFLKRPLKNPELNPISVPFICLEQLKKFNDVIIFVQYKQWCKLFLESSEAKRWNNRYRMVRPTTNFKSLFYTKTMTESFHLMSLYTWIYKFWVSFFASILNTISRLENLRLLLAKSWDFNSNLNSASNSFNHLTTVNHSKIYRFFFRFPEKFEHCIQYQPIKASLGSFISSLYFSDLRKNKAVAWRSIEQSYSKIQVKSWKEPLKVQEPLKKSFQKATYHQANSDDVRAYFLKNKKIPTASKKNTFNLSKLSLVDIQTAQNYTLVTKNCPHFLKDSNGFGTSKRSKLFDSKRGEINPVTSHILEIKRMEKLSMFFNLWKNTHASFSDLNLSIFNNINRLTKGKFLSYLDSFSINPQILIMDKNFVVPETKFSVSYRHNHDNISRIPEGFKNHFRDSKIGQYDSSVFLFIFYIVYYQFYFGSNSASRFTPGFMTVPVEKRVGEVHFTLRWDPKRNLKVFDSEFTNSKKKKSILNFTKIASFFYKKQNVGKKKTILSRPRLDTMKIIKPYKSQLFSHLLLSKNEAYAYKNLEFLIYNKFKRFWVDLIEL